MGGFIQDQQEKLRRELDMLKEAHSHLESGSAQVSLGAQNQVYGNQVLYQDSTSGNGTSSISQSNANQSNSRTDSFKPCMTRELKQLERTNKKLKKHQQQYRQFYRELVDEDADNWVELRLLNEQDQKIKMEQIQQFGPPRSGVPQSSKPKFKRDPSQNTSMMSNSTSQGLTNYDKVRKSRESFKKNFATEIHSFRQEPGSYERKSAVRSQKSFKSLKSARQNTKSLSNLSTNNKSQKSFKKLPPAKSDVSSKQPAPKHSNEATARQQQVAQNDKMAQLQQEYQRIQERRLKIMQSIQQEVVATPTDKKQSTFNNSIVQP